jgi:hypothetical protein
MDHLHYRLNFDRNKSGQKFHHSLKERHKISNIPKYKRFLGEDPRPSYFPHKSLTCCGNGKEGKIGGERSSPKEIRVGEAIIPCRLKCKFKVVIY